MFHWWYIPLGFVVLVIALFAALLFNMHKTLPWRNCFAALSNLKIKLPAFARGFIQDGARNYSTLPDALVMTDGTKVTTPEQFETRKGEILRLFERHVYGTLPREGFAVSFETAEEGEALNGAAVRKQIRIRVTTEKGGSDALMLVYIPKTDKPAPAIIGLNFRGNHATLEDAAILPSYSTETSDGEWERKRGSAAYRWNIADSVARGYAVATVAAADFAPDQRETYNSRIISLFEDDTFKAVGAWAFGILRGVDYLMGDDAIDHRRIAVVGHSRLGKAAVWAGANDPRIGLVISNDSGNTGASLSRENRGETVYSINRAFPHWFCADYARYGNKEETLPVDQNLLLASIAPRKLYVASAAGDLWADPRGAFNSLQSATKAFRLYYGDAVLPDGADAYPAVNTAFHCESMGFHLRAGWHDIRQEDWKFYLDYMDRYFR